MTFIFFVSYLPELYLLSQDIENLDLHVFPFDLMFLAATRVPGIANTFGPSISLYCTGDSKYKNIFKNSHICNLALFRST